MNEANCEHDSGSWMAGIELLPVRHLGMPRMLLFAPYLPKLNDGTHCEADDDLNETQVNDEKW